MIEKIIYFTDAGMKYAKKIILPAANVEVDVMTELVEEDIVELIRLTTLFSNCMKKKFNEIEEEKTFEAREE